MKKVPHTSLSTFDYLTGRPQGLCLIVCGFKFFRLFGMGFFMIYTWLILLGGVLGLVIKYFNMLIPVLIAILSIVTNN